MADHPFTKRIILGGPPRSGSTLLRFILDRSEHIVAGPETNFFLHPLWRCQERAERVAGRIGRQLEINADKVRQCILSASSSLEAFDGIMKLFSDSVGVAKPAWAEKTPTNCFAYHRLAAEDPDALFISIIRNGLDIVTSRIEGHPKRKGYWCSIQYYVDSMVAVYAFDSPHHRIIRYEDLVRDPRSVVSELFGFMRLPFNGDVVVADSTRPSKTRDLSKVNQPKVKMPIQDTWIDRWEKPEHSERIGEFTKHPTARYWLEHSGYSV